MSDFKFTKGQFIQLKANSVIHLGRLERNIYEGDVVEFDGFSLKFNGSTTDMPELKAGVKRGWLSVVESSSGLPTEVEVKAPAPVSTPRKEMEIQRVYDEEKSVSEIKKPAKEEKKKFPLVVENQDEDIIPVAKIEDDSGASINYSSTEGDGVSESQGATSVSSIKLKTAASSTTVISDGSQASAEISKLDNMEVNVSKTASQSEETTVSADDFFDELQEDDSVDEQALENTQLLQAIDGEVQPQQGAVVVGKDESKVKLLPSGVEWDTSKHWSKRAKIAIDMYGDNPDVLNEIISVESKGVASAIQKAMS